jgi:hypothetical protein
MTDTYRGANPQDTLNLAPTSAVSPPVSIQNATSTAFISLATPLDGKDIVNGSTVTSGAPANAVFRRPY